MIILITGASHTGKTALAQRLLKKYHYPYPMCRKALCFSYGDIIHFHRIYASN